MPSIFKIVGAMTAGLGYDGAVASGVVLAPIIYPKLGLAAGLALAGRPNQKSRSVPPMDPSTRKLSLPSPKSITMGQPSVAPSQHFVENSFLRSWRRKIGTHQFCETNVFSARSINLQDRTLLSRSVATTKNIASKRSRKNCFQYGLRGFVEPAQCMRVMILARPEGRICSCYCNFAYSALACFRMGMSGSASFQRVRKSL